MADVCKFFAYFLVLCNFFLITALGAQTQPDREELKRLQKQIDELRKTQESIQKDLQEIKTRLQGYGAAPTAPTATTVSIEDEPFKGHKDTKVVLVEFSDYQCPFCARFFTETFPQIEKDYIATGKIKYVLRDFPIESMHPDALKAHEAANCAGAQGKYWEMHDRLFQNQNQLGVAELPNYARAIDLNTTRFQECLKSGREASEIRSDVQDGQGAGVQGTPAFFVGMQEADGKTIKIHRTIVGALPYGQFKSALDDVLNQAKQ